MQIDLDGRMYEVQAKVLTLSGYAGHADQAALVRFARGSAQAAKRIVLVHGETGAKQALSAALVRHFESQACNPEVVIAS